MKRPHRLNTKYHILNTSLLDKNTASFVLEFYRLCIGNIIRPFIQIYLLKATFDLHLRILKM
jgi:hypothetical protein